MALATRVEHDLVGDRDVPADAYYGVHTVRAVENFAITGSTIAQFPDLIAALAAVKQAAARANPLTVTMAAEAGQLQLNAFEPVIAYSLLRSLTHLRAACDTLATRCVPGITANREHLHDTVHRSVGLVTALAPHIGYAASTTLAL